MTAILPSHRRDETGPGRAVSLERADASQGGRPRDLQPGGRSTKEMRLMATLQDFVRNAATHLDSKFPGWAQQINQDDLLRIRFLPEVQLDALRSAWLYEIFFRLETPSAEEARVEAGMADYSGGGGL